jgi:hypothetical protein
MPAYRRFCPYDHEADMLQAWCRRQGIDALALFDGSPRVPKIWRDDRHAWWVVPLPNGREEILVVANGSPVRH